MNATGNISTPDILEFVIFCIENVAASLGAEAERVYSAFVDKSDILYDYIVPEYENLHTQSKEGVSEMHCMSREYLADELDAEYRERR